ncbi:hypothetical protein E2C01_015020 [Portunus trituberculatus]|uniref:Uncharacterized protein n=1 Tax=Portunus trituberculatus TaxID=210409 RepID=A0A5B7DLU9_PORTR|nr:hypothetical protein [Portunus trituberculatus]
MDGVLPIPISIPFPLNTTPCTSCRYVTPPAASSNSQGETQQWLRIRGQAQTSAARDGPPGNLGTCLTTRPYTRDTQQ